MRGVHEGKSEMEHLERDDRQRLYKDGRSPGGIFISAILHRARQIPGPKTCKGEVLVHHVHERCYEGLHRQPFQAVGEDV